jgi:hypothetical protein
VERGENPHFSVWNLYYMKKKAVTISASELIGFLEQELNQLPDNRKGNNKKYGVIESAYPLVK